MSDFQLRGTIPLNVGDRIRITYRYGMKNKVEVGEFVGLYINIHNGLGLEFNTSLATVSVSGAAIIDIDILREDSNSNFTEHQEDAWIGWGSLLDEG